jgi:hypothetical protein
MVFRDECILGSGRGLCPGVSDLETVQKTTDNRRDEMKGPNKAVEVIENPRPGSLNLTADVGRQEVADTMMYAVVAILSL